MLENLNYNYFGMYIVKNKGFTLSIKIKYESSNEKLNDT